VTPDGSILTEGITLSKSQNQDPFNRIIVVVVVVVVVFVAVVVDLRIS
jgi:hypothetical protein